MKPPTHFDYEIIDAWERALRARGIFATIARKYRGRNIVSLHVEMTIHPGDPLPLLPGLPISEAQQS